MPSTTSRRTRSTFQAARIVTAEAEAEAARIGAMARKRQAAAEVADLADDMAAAGLTLTAEAEAEVAEARTDAAKRRNAPILPADRTRIGARELVTLANRAAARALATERRAGWNVTRDALAELAPDVAAEVVALTLAEVAHADARAYFLAPYGTPVADARAARLIRGAERGPRWDGAPMPDAPRLAAAYRAATDASGRWAVALLAAARPLARRYRTEAEHGAKRVDSTEARVARSADLMAEAEADARAIADALADMSEAEERGTAILISRVPRGARGSVGVTSREWAERRNVTPAAERKAAERATRALAERWPTRADLAADLKRAKRARQAAATAEVAERVTAEAASIGWSAEVAAAALDRAGMVKAAADALAAAARVAAARPARRACYRYAPRADRRTVAERLRQSAAATAPTRAAGVLAWMAAAEHLAEVAEDRGAYTEAAAERAEVRAYVTRPAPTPAPRVADAPRAERRTSDGIPAAWHGPRGPLAAEAARALTTSTERYRRTRMDADRAMARRAERV